MAELSGPAISGRGFETILRTVGAGAVAGMAAGLVWGGVGGRLAMRLLVLTSDDRVRGLVSDDGFEIGKVTVSSLNLLVAAALLGTFGGVGFGLLRSFTRGKRWIVAAAAALTAAVVGGGLFVDAEGIDFHVLEPLWLAVGLFVVLPGAWGATVALATDHFIAQGNRLFNLQPFVMPQRHATTSVVAWLAVGCAFVLGVIELVSDIAQLT